MKSSIEKVVSDLGILRIENLIGTEVPTNMAGLYPENNDTDTSLFLWPEENLIS